MQVEPNHFALGFPMRIQLEEIINARRTVMMSRVMMTVA
jgi:hypothetical protein